MKILRKVLQFKYLIIFLVIAVIFSYFRVNYFYKSKYKEDDHYFLLEVKSIKKKNDKQTIFLSGKENLVYYCEVFPYDVGDILKVTGSLKKIKKETIPHNFDYAFYLQSKKVFYELKIEDIERVKKNNSFLNVIKKKIVNRIEQMDNKDYFYAFILGDTSYFSNEEREKYEYNGLSYLLSIGSLQMMVIIGFINFILEKFKLKKEVKLIICSLYIIFYLLICHTIGLIRSGICYIIKNIFDYFKIEYKYSNIILFVGTIFLLVNPFYLYNIGFQYSFIISYAITFMHKKIKGNIFKRLLQISFYAFIFSLPISIYHNYEINFLTIIFSIIYAPIINYVLFPLSIITFIFPKIIPVFNCVVFLLKFLNNIFFQVSSLHFTFRKVSLFIIGLYYLLIILSQRNKKYYTFVLAILMIHININLFLNEKFIFFLDVSQGDAMVIKDRDNLYLVDTGGSINYEYSSQIVKYIKSLGLNKIDKMFITHGDMDHLGSSYEIVNKINVKQVYFNNNEYNENEIKLINLLKKKKIPFFKLKDYYYKKNNIIIDGKSYYSSNENDSSIIIKLNIDNYKFLLMGDASNRVDKLLINDGIEKVDVIKVGHHGSRTSTSNELISKVNPAYSVISVGENNLYKHPNIEVLDRLNKTIIYRTDKDGSIMFKIKNNKLEVETCSP